MAPTGIETAAFRLAVECLDLLSNHVWTRCSVEDYTDDDRNSGRNMSVMNNM